MCKELSAHHRLLLWIMLPIYLLEHCIINLWEKSVYVCHGQHYRDQIIKAAGI